MGHDGRKVQRNVDDAVIRQVKKSEWEPFQRFLERSYGHGWGYFPRNYPQIYRLEDECLRCFYVIEKGGEIVSHVGLFPLEVIANGVRITIGGIGGVATLPEERGKGYMGKLIHHVIEKMCEKNLPLSVLWGDQQRYGNFGWETAGEKVIVHTAERSMSRADIKSVQVKEVPPEEAEVKVKKFYPKLKFRVERDKKLISILRKPGNRIWLADDGYLCGWLEDNNTLIVKEVISLSGNEASMVKAIMERCLAKQAEIELSREDTERFSRFMQVASGWKILPEGMFRINNCFELLNCFKPLLQERASELRLGDFSLSLGLRFGGRIDVAGLKLTAGLLHISKRKIEPYAEIDERDAVRLFIGGPFHEKANHIGVNSDRAKFAKFATLLPLPVHIPALDHI